MVSVVIQLYLWGIDMINLSQLNSCCSKVPKINDVLVVETKKSKGRRFLVSVKDVVNGNEVILQKSTNSFYNHDMYYAGESWVNRVWNLGKIELTTSINNMNQFADK